MEDSNLTYSNHARVRMREQQIPTSDVKHTVQTGNTVNFGSKNSTNVHYNENCKVVESNNHVITVLPNKRNTSFDLLRNKKKTLKKLKYQVEVRNNVRAMCELAEVCLSGEFGKKNVNRAYELFLRASERGNSHAMCKISELYESGELGKPDKEKAKEWMLKSADRGNTYALAVTGQRLLHEHNQNKIEGKVSSASDINKILYYLKKAASKSSTRALWTLGNIYECGLLGNKDINKAIDLYTKAAKSGSPASVQSLHDLCQQRLFSCEKLEDILNTLVGYLSKSSIGMLRQIGVNQINCEVGFSRSRGLNMVEAAVLNLKTHEDAIINLIHCYKKGIACDSDLRLCQYWYNELYSLYRTSSEQGNVESLWKMGKLYLKGFIGDIDLDKAESCFRRAVSISNNLEYKIDLGDMYCNGILGDKDIKIGEELIKEALKKKEQKALKNNYNECYSLGLIYNKCEYSFASYEKAYYWFHKAAEGGVEDAEFSLAELYLDKKSGYTNIQEGLKIIEKLILNGHISCPEGFMYISSYLTLEDYEYISWLKGKSELKLSPAQVENSLESEEYILKRECLKILAEGYGQGKLGAKKDIKLASQWNYKLFDEFKIHQSISFFIHTYHLGELPDEFHSFVKDWVMKLPNLLEESTDHELFFELCSLLGETFYHGKLVSLDLLESAKYICINHLRDLPQEEITSKNVLDLLPKEYSSVIDELSKSEFIAAEICRLAEKFKTTSLILYQLLSRMLGDVFFGGFIAKQDIEKAIYWYSEASLLNNGKASLTLARIYRSTNKKNLEKSLKFYEVAIKQGNELAVKELVTFIEENPMFKIHLPFLDNYTHKSSIPQHLILETPPFKNLTQYPSDSTEMHELAMAYLSNLHTSKQSLYNAVYWLRKDSSNLKSLVELFLIYNSGMLGENVKPVADKIKIDIIKWCRARFSSVKSQVKGSESDVKAGLESLASTLESLKKLSDDILFHDIITNLGKCIVNEEIVINPLNEIIALCNEVIDKSKCHMLVKEGYRPEFKD